MQGLEYKKLVLPDFPKTAHLPIEPNADRTDKVASEEELQALFSADIQNITIEEKVDSANCGMTLLDGEPVIRNRNKILSKNYEGRKTPAKMQFSAIWTWFYENKDKFEDLKKILGFMPCVYGEWMYAQHTVQYENLPSWFIPFDVFDYERREYISPLIYRPALEKVGFTIVPKVDLNKVSRKTLIESRDMNSIFSPNHRREGIYIKLCDGDKILSRYKMVRNGFIQGEHWNKTGLIKNKVEKVEK